MAEHKGVHLLLDKARGGDRVAFAELCTGQKDRLASFIMSRMGTLLQGKTQPEDILQETLLRAFQSIRVFRGTDEKTFHCWLAGIAEHLVWNASQKHALRETTLACEVPDGGVSASRAMRRKERLERLERALSSLRPDQRTAILLAKIEGLKVKDIAERMGRSEGAVRQLLSRGLRLLREEFGDTESLHLPDQGLVTGGADDTER